MMSTEETNRCIEGIKKEVRKDERQKILDLIEDKLDFWEKYVEFLLSRVEYEPEDKEIQPSKIRDGDIRRSIIQTLTIADELDELKQKLEGEE